MKFQERFGGFEISESCKIASIINSIEYIVDEHYLEYVELVNLENSILKLQVYPEANIDQVLEDLKSRIGDFLEVEVYVEKPSLTPLKKPVLGDKLKRLYLEFGEKAKSIIHPIMRSLAFKTADSRIEYYAVLYGGELIVVEGEKGKVNIPRVNAYATAHTHPRGHCMFSWKDIETVLDLFSRGGLLSSIVTVDCSVTICRLGFFTLRDYEVLLDFRDDIKRGKILEAISKIKNSENLRLEFSKFNMGKFYT